METEAFYKMGADGPHREPAVGAIRSRALSMIEQGKEMVHRGQQFLALAKQLEEIEKYAASQSCGGDGPVPYIGVGSDAEQALWELAICIAPKVQ